MPTGVYIRTEKSKNAKGKKHPHTLEAKQKIKNAWNNPEYRENQIRKKIGRKLSEITKQKISKSHLGKNNWTKGRVVSEETRQKMSISHKGLNVWSKGKPSWNKGLKGFLGKEKHWNWKDGISRDKHSVTEPKYKEWREKVFKRDGYKCKINNNCVVYIQAHHILPWRDYEELRYDVNNGITLCLAHHPRKRAEEKRLAPMFQELVSVSN